MGVLVLPGVLALAWILAAAGVDAPGSTGGHEFDAEAMRWMLTLPMGAQMIVSGFMHTALAKSTAKGIGWVTNGFQYELGFICFGLGVSGLIATSLNTDAWIPLAIVFTAFLVGAGINHVVEMVRDKNFAPGNTLVLLYDFGLPLSVWPLLISVGAV